MKNLTKFTLCLSKIMECLCWLAGGLAGLAAVLFVVARDWLEDTLLFSMSLPEGAAGGLALVLTDGYPNVTSLVFSALAGVALAALSAMIFHNIYRILKTAEGKTPFQKEVPHLMKQIGIFLISTSGVNLVWSVIMKFALGVAATELSIELDSILMGMMVLCLSHFFDYGVSLQQDVDGLL